MSTEPLGDVTPLRRFFAEGEGFERTEDVSPIIERI
jgi:hypothetical protein